MSLKLRQRYKILATNFNKLTALEIFCFISILRESYYLNSFFLNDI